MKKIQYILFRVKTGENLWLSPIFVYWMLLFFAPCLSAQTSFQNPLVFNTAKGLLSNRAHTIASDKNGVAWIASYNGLTRFDGLTYENYQHVESDSNSILSHAIAGIFPDHATGKVWVSTQRGLSVFDPVQKHFKNYTHKVGEPNSIPDQVINCVYKDIDQQIWIGIRGRGIVRYRPETDDFQRYFCLDEDEVVDGMECNYGVKQIVPDPSNDSILWAVGEGVIRFNRISGALKQFRFNFKGDKKQLYVNAPTSMIISGTDKIFLGTWYFGVQVFDMATGELEEWDPCCDSQINKMENLVIHGFHVENEHTFWINTNKGLQLYDAREKRLLAEYVNDVKKKKLYSVNHIDAEGRWWSATRSEGFQVFNPLMEQYTTMQYEDSDADFSTSTRRILEDTLRKRLYIGAGATRGLHYYDQKKERWNCVLPPIDYPKKVFGLSDIVLLDNGTVIILETHEIYWYQPGWPRMRKYPVQPKDKIQRVRASMLDSEGNVWIGAWTGGFHRLNPKTKELVSFKKPLEKQFDLSLGGDHMVEDKNGNIWMRENNGLLIYEKAKDDFLYIPYTSENLKAYRGMGRMEAEETGRVWIATQKKYLAYGHADSLERGMIRRLGKKEGMIGNKVYLVKKHKDQLLVFTDKGMQLFDPKVMRFGKYYDAGYGLGGYVFNGIFLADGQLAIGREKAIALFYPDSLVTNEELPLPYITSFKVFDKILNIESSPGEQDSIYLSYKQNFFSFEFSAIGYNLPHKTRFRYQLEGFDEKWQDGTARRFAAYTNVPGGEYRFKVEAVNSEGLSLAEPHVVYLEVSTVWYKTVLFWCLTTIFLAGMGYLIYRWRINQVRKEERLKSSYESRLADVKMSALRAQMNPHFIFNSLNSIEYYIISNEPERAVDYLGRFSRLIRLILQNSKSTIVPLKDDLDALQLYIEMESMRFDNLFDYEVKMEKGIDPEQLAVPPMILQPYVENAIWHGLMQKRGEKGKLDLTLRKSNGHLICLIEDNGIGREAASALKSKSAVQRKSFGMKITSDRLAMLNKLAGADASVKVFDLKKEDGQAAGTRVELIIPI